MNVTVYFNEKVYKKIFEQNYENQYYIISLHV